MGRVDVAGLELFEGGGELLGQAGAAQLDGPREGAVSGVELLALPRHGAAQQLALLIVGEVVEHLDVIAAGAPLRRVGRRGQPLGVIVEPGASLCDEGGEVHPPTTLHNSHDESNSADGALTEIHHEVNLSA